MQQLGRILGYGAAVWLHARATIAPLSLDDSLPRARRDTPDAGPAGGVSVIAIWVIFWFGVRRLMARRAGATAKRRARRRRTSSGLARTLPGIMDRVQNGHGQEHGSSEFGASERAGGV